MEHLAVLRAKFVESYPALLGDIHEHDSPVRGISFARNESALLHLRYEHGDRRLRQSLKEGKLGDTPAPLGKCAEDPRFGARDISLQVPPHQPAKSRCPLRQGACNLL